MNIELEEVVVLDVSDDVLEMAAGGAQGGMCASCGGASCSTNCPFVQDVMRVTF